MADATGLAIESATAHVEIAVFGRGPEPLAHEIEDVGHGHTRRLAPLVARALASAGREPKDLTWIAADLGPGSFTGVRVGLAAAEALALAGGARLHTAPSLASLACGAGISNALIVPLVPAGHRDVYAGYYRADRQGVVSVLAAPRVGTIDEALAGAHEALALLGSRGVHCVGPAAARERDAVERAFPGATAAAWRFEGLSAIDLARAARSRRRAALGLGAPDAAPQPLYVRPAQAEETVRRRALASQRLTLREFAHADVPAVVGIERRVFGDPWTESFFHGELGQALVYARVAELDGALAGYCVAWLGAGEGHLGNLAVAPEQRRRGIARALLDELLVAAEASGAERLTLEVRTSNFAAQGLYRAHGFRLAGLRRGYYRDNGEDALIMEWRAPATSRRSAS
ncbi:MAG TPA: ribosomal protein S18-alanine N-acetyltransferase [Candidatus Saccharimonadaceae bacterium]|jgi:ribosomal-protein-alanine acetyltransferase/tRNA threonylcarbamoyl adenosine modification protein YeaZ|nr:ribosomal protein S18-alanine N-acetyltransferase [Candidatus Saccharimonadaceae bacterium]